MSGSAGPDRNNGAAPDPKAGAPPPAGPPQERPLEAAPAKVSPLAAAMNFLAQRNAALRAGKLAAAERERTAALREATLRSENEAATAQDELAASITAQLREANERLIVATIQAQTMTEAAQDAAVQMAYVVQHDYLTGLPNRALLADRLAQAIALAQRHGKQVAVMFLDLDHFKHVYDTLGHAAGDELLQAVAARLLECVRRSDTVCRQGGDEFVVLLAEVEAADAAAVSAAKIVGAMTEPFLVAGQRLHVTLSIGISLYPQHGKDAEALLGCADTAMYQAKKSGRNNYQVFDHEMNVRAFARLAVESALRQALEQRQFVLHYQPKVDLESGGVTGAEALLRLRRPGQPLLYPGQFIGVAEESGLMQPIGKWVLGEACRQATAWSRAGLGVGRIAVNVSAVEFQGHDFLAGVRATLAETGLDPRLLELELTESGLMQDTQRTTGVLRALKDLGVQVAIDDFGTGYSSLSYLRRFPVDTLKIDQSFVQDIGDDTGESVLVGAIIAMGRSLKLQVVAEGVETAQQLAFLRAQSCAEGQGYYFSPPVDAKEFGAILAIARP